MNEIMKCQYWYSETRLIASRDGTQYCILPGHGDRRANQIRQRQRQQKLPAERHQLVVAEARQRPAHPDIEKKKTENLGREPEHRQHAPATIGGPNNGPCHPPKNSSVARHATVIMLAYSAMKNMANFIALYSV